MKAYVITTCMIFGLITVAHVWRGFVETNLVKEPWYIITTLLGAALSIWGARLWQRWPRA